jgi:hypothetical protein
VSFAFSQANNGAITPDFDGVKGAELKRSEYLVPWRKHLLASLDLPVEELVDGCEVAVRGGRELSQRD